MLLQYKSISITKLFQQVSFSLQSFSSLLVYCGEFWKPLLMSKKLCGRQNAEFNNTIILKSKNDETQKC